MLQQLLNVWNRLMTNEANMKTSALIFLWSIFTETLTGHGQGCQKGPGLGLGPGHVFMSVRVHPGSQVLQTVQKCEV